MLWSLRLLPFRLFLACSIVDRSAARRLVTDPPRRARTLRLGYVKCMELLRLDHTAVVDRISMLAWCRRCWVPAIYAVVVVVVVVGGGGGVVCCGCRCRFISLSFCSRSVRLCSCVKSHRKRST